MASVAVGRRALARRWIAAKRARALVAAVAGLAVLFIVLAVYLQGGPGTPLDVAVTRAIQGAEIPGFGPLMVGVSAFGFTPLSQVVTAAAVAGFWWAGLRREALYVVVSLGAGLLSGGIKLLVARPRPDPDLVQVTSHLLDFSFPSGHVTSYVSFFGLLFFLFYVLFKGCWWRYLGLAFFGALIALVGASRIYLGHHWFSDVMAGYALGTAYLLVVMEVYTLSNPRTRRPPEADSHEAGSESPLTPPDEQHAVDYHRQPEDPDERGPIRDGKSGETAVALGSQGTQLQEEAHVQIGGEGWRRQVLRDSA